MDRDNRNLCKNYCNYTLLAVSLFYIDYDDRDSKFFDTSSSLDFNSW